MKYFLMVVCLLALSACSVPAPVIPSPRPEPLVKQPEISGELEIGAREAIEHALRLLPAQMRDALREITVTSNREHVVGDEGKAIGHVCPENSRKICLLRGKVNMRLVWHECAHVYSFHLSDYYLDYDSLHFQKLWEKIAGDVYTEKFNEARAEGLLTSYSRRNSLEDVAEWYKECMHYLYLDSNWQVFEDNKYLKTDLRYRQKLALMHKYGFFSNHEYERLKPLFQ